MRVFSRLREVRWLRYTVQVLLVVVLLGMGYIAATYDRQVGESKQATQAAQSIFAQACDVAPFEDLKAQGLLEECRLAQAGELGQALQEEAEQQDVIPAVDPIPDDPDTEPTEVQQISQERLDAAVVAAVDNYFEANPLPGDDDYREGIQRAVAQFLTANPPPRGRPPSPGEIRTAVRNALLANPPDAGPPGSPGEPGEDGDNGVGVANASLDGCDVVFTFSDGSTDRVGPLCGEDGEPGPPPSDADLAAQVSAYCQANGECRGPAGIVTVVDDCSAQNGRFLTDVSTDYDRATSTLRITCESAGVLGP